MNQEYKYACSPEAASDIPHIFKDPSRKFHHASVEDFNLQGEYGQTIRFHFELDGHKTSQDYNAYSIVEMPIANVMELLKFAMRTMADSYHLTHTDILPSWNVDPANS